MFEHTISNRKQTTTIGLQRISKAKLRKLINELTEDIDPMEPLWSLATTTDYKLHKAIEELTYAAKGLDPLPRTRRAVQLLMVYLHETLSPQSKRGTRGKDTSGSSPNDV